MNQTITFHGSDLERVSELYQIPKEEITNFGANVNPLGISPSLRSELASNIDVITRYPDPDYVSLRRCLSEYTGASIERIIVGNGSTELISLVIQTLLPNKVLMIGPTYSEYERELSLHNGTAMPYFLREETDFCFDFDEFKKSMDKEISLVVLCNPNNPTSSAINISQMRQLLNYCSTLGVTVMIDETYAEFAENIYKISAISLLDEFDNFIVIRGVSKFFAAPGLRLGYAITSNDRILESIKLRKNPWSLNSLAALAGEIMFRDSQYIENTRDFISKEHIRVCQALDNCTNIKYYMPAANFILVKILKESVTAHDLFEAAILKGCMIRDCSTFPSLKDRFIRFCFMEEDKNNQLLDILLSYLNG